MKRLLLLCWVGVAGCSGGAKSCTTLDDCDSTYACIVGERCALRCPSDGGDPCTDGKSCRNASTPACPGCTALTPVVVCLHPDGTP